MPRIAPLRIDVLAAGQLGVKAGADFEQARDPAPDRDAALARLGDARQNFEQGRFAGAVAADDAEHLAAPDLETTSLSAQNSSTSSPATIGRPRSMSGGAAQNSARAARQHVAQRDIALALGLVADDVSLAEPLGADDDVGHHAHQIRSAKVRFGAAEIARCRATETAATTPRLSRKPGM